MSFLDRFFKPKPVERPARPVAPLVEGMAGPAAHLVKSPGPSRSHLGGSPRLPDGVPWPAREGRRLDFLARLSLEELRRCQVIDWLPATGALLFFYDVEEQPWGFDPKDRGSAVVLHVPDLPAPLAEPAAGAGAGAEGIPHRNVALRAIGTLPSTERAAVAALGLSDAESGAYLDLADGVYGNAPKHQVGGFPSTIQADTMELECQLASNGVYCGGPDLRDPRTAVLSPGAVDWRLLLQLDTDEAIDLMWGDAGIIYFWIRATDASAGAFDKVWLILQCC